MTFLQPWSLSTTKLPQLHDRRLSWWTGLPPYQFVHVRGSSICLRRYYNLKLTYSQLHKLRCCFGQRRGNFFSLNFQTPSQNLLSLLAHSARLRRSTKICYISSLLLYHLLPCLSGHLKYHKISSTIHEISTIVTSNVSSITTTTTRHRPSTSTRRHFMFGLCCHSNDTRAPIANPPNSAQPQGIPYHSPSYIWVRAVVWKWSKGETHRHTWPIYISHCLWLTRNVTITSTNAVISK